MDKMTAEWLAAGLLLALPGIAMIALNYYLIYLGYKEMKLPEEERSQYSSGAPLLGGVLVALGILVALRGKHIWLTAIPLLLDPGGISGIVWSEICSRRDQKKTDDDK